MAETRGEIHVGNRDEASEESATLGEGSALALRRVLFMYATLAAGAFGHPRNLTLASVAAGAVPHSVRRMAFFHACARSAEEARGEAIRVPIQ